jgi:hypothetical protein
MHALRSLWHGVAPTSGKVSLISGVHSHCPELGISKLVDDIAVDDGLGWPAIETHERAKATAQTFVNPAASGGAWNG